LHANVCNIPVYHTASFLVASTGNLNVVMQNCERSSQTARQHRCPQLVSPANSQTKERPMSPERHTTVPLSDGLYSKLITTWALKVQDQKQTSNK